MKNKILLTIFLSAFLIVPFLAGAQSFSEEPVLSSSADTEIQTIKVPMLFVTDVKVDGTSFNTGDTITGTFIILNQEKPGHPYYAGLFYKIQLRRLIDKSGSTYDPFNLVLSDTKIFDEEIVSISGEKKEKTFVYQLPQNLLSGKYVIDIILARKEGTELAIKQSKIFTIKGNDHFIDIISLGVKRDDNVFDAFVGPNFLAEESPIIIMQAVALSKRVINADLKGIIRDRAETGEILNTFDAGVFAFQPGEQKDIEINIPKIENPGSYLAFLQFAENSQPISPEVSARFVIKGESAQIIEIFADKEIYNAGDTAIITVYATGFADTIQPSFFDGKLVDAINPRRLEDFFVDLYIGIFDKKTAKLVGEAKEEVNLSSSDEAEFINFDKPAFEISVPVSQKTDYYKVEVELSKEGKVLDKKNISSPLPQEGFIGSASVIYIFIILLAAILFYLIVFKTKKII